METTLTSPNAGLVTIDEEPVGGGPPAGWQFIGQQVVISAPAATATNPLVLVFLLDSSVAQDETAVQLFKDGVFVPSCTGTPGEASPDPCVSGRARAGDDVRLTVLTSSASTWTFAASDGVDTPTSTPTPTQTPTPTRTPTPTQTPVSVRINDVSQAEDNRGKTKFEFTVELSGASSRSVTVDFTTADRSALAGSDYVSAAGTLTFSGNRTSRTITVQVNGDTIREPNECFVVILSNPTNATIADGEGEATIVNDD